MTKFILSTAVEASEWDIFLKLTVKSFDSRDAAENEALTQLKRYMNRVDRGLAKENIDACTCKKTSSTIKWLIKSFQEELSFKYEIIEI